MKSPKTFDCVRMKEDIQRRLLDEMSGLTAPQQQERTDEIIRSDADLARFWRLARPVASRPASGIGV